MNIHIIKGLFDDCPGLVNQYFISETFSFRDCMDMKRLYDTVEFPQSIAAKMPGQNHSFFSFGCDFTHRQLKALAVCADTYALFNVQEVTAQDMEDLFACKPGFHIRVNNLRRIAVLFDALLENNLVQWNWQSILWHNKLLIAKRGNGYVSQSSLSTALSASRECPTSASEGIRKAVAMLSNKNTGQEK